MSIRHAAIIRIVAILGAGLLASCSGSGYGGGGGSRPPASLTISVEPDTITLGDSATVTWTSNAPCTASGAWSGSRPASGNETVTPTATGTFTYTLTCSGGGYSESNQESATLTVNPTALAGLWVGDGCCIASNAFPVVGMTGASGDYRFLVLGKHYVGEIGATPAAYATCDTCLAGAREADSQSFSLLEVTPGISARAGLRGRSQTAQPTNFEFLVPFNSSLGRARDVAALQGIYSTNLGTGYTVTIIVEATGQISGVDTNGCRLLGRGASGSPNVGVHDVVLDVTACGNRNGRYHGIASLIYGGTERPTELFLSTSNAKAAIGWRLSR